MDCANEARGPQGVVSTAARWFLGVLLLSGTLGCDHRISLGQFLQMQQGAGGAPTTQPAPPKGATREIRIDELLGPYKVGASDVLRVTVIGSGAPGEIPPVQARVRRDGKIELPLVGAVQVAGKQLGDAERAVREAYTKGPYKEATVHVELVEAETTPILVTGAVTSPGLVQLRRNERNLLYAIVAAGGVSTMASGRVTLCRIRRPKEATTLSLVDPDGLKAALALAPLESGDIVTVEAATPNTVFVGGLVNAPSPQSYPAGVRVTVLQAIAAAAGLRADVLPREATLIRRMPSGRDVHVKLNLDRLTSGEDPNITLAAGDILWVPHTIETRVQEWISRNIYLRGGVSAGLTYNFIHTKDILRGDNGGGTSLLIGGGGGPSVVTGAR